MIGIFYHVGQIIGSNWEILYQEQMHSLVSSGLYKKASFIHIGVNGSMILPFVMDKCIVHYNHESNWNSEAQTLNSLWDFSNSTNVPFKVLYLHTKGTMWNHRTDDHGKSVNFRSNAWRLLMEYFVIHRWRDCVECLDDYDSVGCEWSQDGTLYGIEKYVETDGYYRGNFWWSKTDYIKRLDPQFLYEGGVAQRYQSEQWIGTKNPNYYNFKSVNVPNLYLNEYLPTDYMD